MHCRRRSANTGWELILDIVPNHMGIGDPCNAWWMDVLENGPGSPYAGYFDIDWHPIKPELENKVLIPILGDQYGVVLEDGKFRLVYEDNGAFVIHYYDSRLPVEPCTYALILGGVAERLNSTAARSESTSDTASEAVSDLQSILTALTYLPANTESDPLKLAERQREKEVIKRRLAGLVNAQPAVQTALTQTLDAYNGHVGDPHSFDALDALIAAQPYRPSYWRVAAEEINYRRFFDINDLAAIRVERADVFADTHRLAFQLLNEGKVNGFRIDHPDGLWDPPGYFNRLQAEAFRQHLDLPDDQQEAALTQFAARENPSARLPLYVVVEKILSEREPLPVDWQVHGTTGYDFMNAVNGIFIASENEKAFDAVYKRFTGTPHDFEALVAECKARTMQASLSSEINVLGRELERINEQNRRYRDFTLNGVTDALREVIACLSIYRTYIRTDEVVSERDRRYLQKAITTARRRSPQTSASIFEFMHTILLLKNLREFPEAEQARIVAFVMKFQQVTGPVMAKSVEDTAFYLYNRLVALNEVGGQPDVFGVSVEAFHRANQQRLAGWPHAMLGTSTHDTKRSEDVRARLATLSEIPGEWNAALNRWKRLNAAHKTLIDDAEAPDRNEEYLFYQTVIGAWPFEPYSEADFATFRDRVAAYMLKAAKEAKIHTSWLNPNPDYDEALRRFIEGALDNKRKNRFIDDILAFQRRIARGGLINALAQQLLKLTVPGVPDIYQGTELWDLSLVDPDNRRPVDYAIRARSLTELNTALDAPDLDRLALVRDLRATAADGRIKLFVTRSVLAYRQAHPALFSDGDYVPLRATGSAAAHLCGFVRRSENEALLVATPRLVAGLGSLENASPDLQGLEGTRLILPSELTNKPLRNLFTGESVTPSAENEESWLDAAALFREFPVAILVSD